MTTEHTTDTLATASVTSTTVFGTSRVALPRNVTLQHVSINVNSALNGPLKVSVAVRFTTNRIQTLGPERWIRGDSDYGFRDTWTWSGELFIDKAEDASIIFLIANDTGSSVDWSGAWTYRRNK